MNYMNEPQAYLNGKWIPATQAVLPVWDAGFVQGTAVAEQLRTFGGRLFRLEEHLQRLERSLNIVGIELGLSLAELAGIAEELSRRNHRLLDPADDLNLTMFVTPGPYPALAPPSAERRPTVCLHTTPLPFGLWAQNYVWGEAVATTPVEQVPAECWPRELKCRSRMHYFLADQHARKSTPPARALMVDSQGLITEATTANIVAGVVGRGLIGPPRGDVLPGISLATLLELAQTAGIPYVEEDLTVDTLAAADELLLCSTSVCLLPVVRFNGSPVGLGQPGPMAATLLAEWSKLVGLDIAGQAARFANR